MFGLNVRTRYYDVTDGSSNTLCVGEGASGSSWALAAVGDINKPLQTGVNGGQGLVGSAWIMPQPTSDVDLDLELPNNSVGNYGTTFWKMNRNPVIETIYGIGNIGTCDPAAGVDGTSNFRSAHEGGGQFLLGDGSTRFISEHIDAGIEGTTNHGVYQHLSTRSGGEAIGEF